MKQIITTVAATAALAALATTAAATSVAREAVSGGFLTTRSSNVLIGSATAFEMIGTTQILRLNVTQHLKGSAPDQVRVALRGQLRDVKSGDELLLWLVKLDGTKVGLGEGDFYTTTALPHWGAQLLTASNKQAWTERVQAHVGGDPATIAHRLAADVSSADKRIAADAFVDLWHLRTTVDLATTLSSQEKMQIAIALMGNTGWSKYELERVHGLTALGAAKAGEAFDLMTQRLKTPMLPETAYAMGQALVKIDAARANQQVPALLTGTPENPVEPAQQLRVLATLRGMASDATLPAVQELFQHADENVRRWALVTAGYLNNPAAVAPLIERLQNGQGLDCHSAAYALHRIGDANGWAEVRRFATAHADPDVRAWLAKFTQNPAMRGQDVLLKLTRGY
ncbi:MAG: HEAT repeat domain-containing protein [Planctomycetota bacterium]|jgi:hypothetical protein